MNRTPIKRRWRARFKSGLDPKYREWVRMHRCVLDNGKGCDCFGLVEAAHVKSRGAGGVDMANLYPCCSKHHNLQHTIGILTFQKRYRLDLRDLAWKLAKTYEEEM